MGSGISQALPTSLTRTGIVYYHNNMTTEHLLQTTWVVACSGMVQILLYVLVRELTRLCVRGGRGALSLSWILLLHEQLFLGLCLCDFDSYNC